VLAGTKEEKTKYFAALQKMKLIKKELSSLNTMQGKLKFYNFDEGVLVIKNKNIINNVEYMVNEYNSTVEFELEDSEDLIVQIIVNQLKIKVSKIFLETVLFLRTR
jgi:hypothetical protein